MDQCTHSKKLGGLVLADFSPSSIADSFERVSAALVLPLLMLLWWVSFNFLLKYNILTEKCMIISSNSMNFNNLSMLMEPVAKSRSEQF